MSIRIVWLFFLFIAISNGGNAQDLSSLRKKRILITQDTTTIDSLHIVANSFHIVNQPDSLHKLLPTESKFVWLGNQFPTDSVDIVYRVISFDFGKVYERKNKDIVGNEFETNPFDIIPEGDRYLEQKGDEIRTLGNISRGIGFGNRQDVTVNSNLNLRLNGRIKDEIDIVAAISDDNNPIQPEGNTQQIQDFDRVFIQLSKDSTQIIAGDFAMVTPDSSYFMKYNKKSRGIHFDYQFDRKQALWKWSGEGAVSRGRFARNTIAGIEGNQGPYRLSGANGETFIIIISGTEQVYLDGETLTRGEQNDYVINYNTGELTFTPKRLITQYSRIVIEFQYSDRNYGRSVVRFGGSYTSGKWNVRGNVFNEQDNKNQPFQQSLDDSTNGVPTRTFLSEAGDAELVFAPKFSEVIDPDASQIVYRQKDSLGNSIFVLASPADTGKLFRVSFSFVGEGNGDYVQKISTANGKVFEWVAPIAGISQGNYAPVEVLVPPKRLQMMTFGVDYAVSKTSQASIEFVQSNNDINTFSTIDKQNDIGYGLRLDFKDNSTLSKDSLHPWRLQSKLSYEMTQKNFRYIERYRDVEFDRKWNRTLDNPSDATKIYNDEQIVGAKLFLTKGRFFSLAVDETFYRQGAANTGLAQEFVSRYAKKGTEITGAYNNILSDIPFQGAPSSNAFESYSASIGKRGKWIGSRLSYLKESSGFSNGSDSLFANSYAFEKISFALENGDSNSVSYGLFVNRRLDENGQEGVLKKSTDGRDANLSVGWRQSRNAQFNLTTTYRELQFLNQDSSNNKPENTLQGRFETRLNLFKKFITTNVYYQLGTGQEQRREYSYLEVGDGLGNYVWNDYDSNGVQSLNEFELASSFDEGRANFIRQFLPVQGFIKSYSSEFNQNIRIRPSAIIGSTDKKSLKFIRRFSNVSSVKIQKKVTNNQEDFINPFVQNVDDASLLSTNSLIRSVMSFNQASPVFGIDYQWFNNQNKVLLINGVDARNGTENKVKVRYNVNKSYEIIVEATDGFKTYTSQFLTDRAFDYDFRSVKPKLGYQYKSKLRFELYYQYFEAFNNKLYGNEVTYNHDVTAEFRWNLLNKGTVRTNIGLVDVNYKGNDNSPVAYELLAGLRNGRNVKWRLQIERRFANNMQVLVHYDGRQSIDNPVIHIGRVQARYLF